LIAAIWGLYGVLDWLDGKVVPAKFPGLKPTWDRFYILPSVTWRQWFFGTSIPLALASLHGAYKFASQYKQRYDELTKHKLKFKVDEVSTRVFVETPSSDIVNITGKIKLRFENEDTHAWSMKALSLTLHKWQTPKNK